MTPSRKALVRATGTTGALEAVTLSRAPWDAPVTEPDAREETRPGFTLIRPTPRKDLTRAEMVIAVLRAEMKEIRV
ncbi:hypothetical protein HOY34_11185 [Xinfangfangia sp. D13-10-4-6]|uniref:hypothetical protein n=1 Tax=Pseudogemmobacter hezensis TaxID=2737662 RepID=UPI00155733C8|nr:hypothetical protein [Pseudogemmobacter hezensis]NPD15766.1 hypothetical protein [Pseudogemmobacter hezensis]